MKHKVWLFQIPIVALFTMAFYISEVGVEGRLESTALRDKVFPTLRMVSGWFTNVKFHIRGVQEHKNKIVIVSVDSDSLESLGRWPWHRDVTAKLIKKTFDAGAKVVGLDVVFSEPDVRVSPDLEKVLDQYKLSHLVPELETDFVLEKVIREHRDHLVTGWTTDSFCQPDYTNSEDCPVTSQDKYHLPQDFDKFAFSSHASPDRIMGPAAFDQAHTPLISSPSFIANMDLYNDAAAHSGFFNAWPDLDGYIRTTNLMMMSNTKAYPALALEMARVGLDEDLKVEFDSRHLIKGMSFAKSGKEIRTTPLGAMPINFRGPGYSFPYVRAIDIMDDADQIDAAVDRKVASVSKSELLKDAYVLIGITALGVYDMRAFPFDSNTAGVEGHATILDNILSDDMLSYGQGKWTKIWIFLLMTVGALLLAYATERLESVPALLLFIITFAGLGAADTKLLFAHGDNWNTGFFFIEITVIAMCTFLVKYVLEERNKKFIKGAFAKYVSPAIIDSIMKDPSKLSVGGEKRELTILFSDIRGFTTFSERLEPQALAGFLNDYLGIMTDLVFANEGTLDKYIGDAVMAFWGAPLDQPKHAANACRAAIKMLQALDANRARFREQYGVEVNIGIGVNSGPVNVGNMGSQTIFEYTVIGDHVNLASRLEGLTKYYGAGIVTTRFTFDHIALGGETEPPHRVLDFVKVKGKKNAVELIQVLERDYSADGLRAFEDARGLYRERKWDEAAEMFKKANALLRRTVEDKDGPSQMYIERCEELKQTPPEADWDGSWEMQSK